MASPNQGQGLLRGQLICLICGQEGLNEENMKTHVLLEHVENTICCPFCDLSGITSDEMTHHINGAHFDEMAGQTDEKQGEINTNNVDVAKGVSKKEDPDKYAAEHGGAIPKTKGKGPLKQSQSLDKSPNRSPAKRSGAMKTSQSESNISRRGRLQLNFDTINEPGPSNGNRDVTSSMRTSVSQNSMRAASLRGSASCDTYLGSTSTSTDSEPVNAQSVRMRLQGSIHSQNGTIQEEGQDNNNLPLQPNLNQVMQPDINDNVEPDINSNMPAAFSCPFCQFITSSENVINTHVNRAHVDVLSPARATVNRTNDVTSEPSTASTLTCSDQTDAGTSSVFNDEMKDEFPCPICMKIYDNSGELSLHVNRDHSQIFSPNRPSPGMAAAAAVNSPVPGPSILHCPVCGLECHDPSRLEAHINGHFSAEQTPIQEKNDKLIAQALQEKETVLAKHDEQKEFQRLQTIYGMVEGTPYKKKYEKNLEQAVVRGDMTVTEYHERRNGFKAAESIGIDDGTSCTKGVVQRLREYFRTPPHGVSRAWLCTTVDHYSGSFGDKGWGCGYRNFQMLLSALMTEPMYKKILFNDKPLMPSILKIQRLIQEAWEKGFDRQGCEQLGGRVLNTEKWIGASEIVATLASLRIKCRLLDFHHPTGPGGTHPKLFEHVKAYFEKPAVFKPPLYLQHHGHSRTIVGIEEMRDKRLRLLIFDPSVQKKQMQLFHSIVNANLMRTLRKPLEGLKSRQYQIVQVIGEIKTDFEWEESKVLKSDRIG